SSTKKSDVGQNLKKVATALQKTIKELQSKELTEHIKGLEKGQEAAATVAEAEKALSELAKATEDLSKAFEGGSESVAEAAQNGVQPDGSAIKTAVAALNKIKDVAAKQDIKLAEASGATVGGTDKDGAKILATDSGGDNGLAAGDASKALAILTKVTGEETLAAVLASKDNDAALTGAATAETTAVSFAKGGNEAHVKEAANAKAAAVTGGIALRSLLKNGKLAHKSTADDNTAAQAVGLNASGKLLGAIEDIIKKTAGTILKKVKKAIDDAREGKGVTTENKAVEAAKAA
ncbi:variable large family protein, partial [Borrelia sp. A-FGy1]|uniref:variable large family protein n=1 Tax=Borrelia sp. A-FGy1 TaxID=2608247 RepID=UPI0015F5BC4B